MTLRSFATAARIGLLVLLGQGAMAQAADIKLLSSTGMKAVLTELVPQFERATGHKVVITYEPAAILKKKIDGGETFDLTILTLPLLDALVKDGKVTGGRVDLARSGVGVAIRAGAPKPDISTVEAFKRTLLNAKSVAYTTAGASGQYFASLLVKLGIADEIKAKAKTQPGGAVAELVARGEAELAISQISEILPVKGAELLGPLPNEIQLFTVFSAGVGASAKEADAAKALIKFLTAPAALPVIKAKGMEGG